MMKKIKPINKLTNSPIHQRGFTLIELLVVLTIITLLVALVIASFTQSKKKARDSRRVSDISSIVKGLALYNNINSFYPSTSETSEPEIMINGTNDVLTTALVDANAMKVVPVDPINSGNYRYYYLSNGASYTLRFCQETSSIQGLRNDCTNTITQ